MKVLVVEDNEILSRNMVRYLSSKDIHAEAAMDWEEWFRKAISKYYDIIILDINLPHKDGLEICKDLREREKDSAIIMLTSRGTNDDIVTGLENWADDYLVKPFEYSELLARMNAVIRRKMLNKSNTKITVWDIVIDLKKITVTKWDEEISLSKLEFELFKYLAQNKWMALSRQEIYETVWWESAGDFMFSKTIDVYVGYLRKKLWKDIIETKKWYWFLINSYDNKN